MPVDKSAPQSGGNDAKAARQTLVAKLRNEERLSVRDIQKRLEADGYRNPDTGKPWSVSLIGFDLEDLRLELTLSRLADTEAMVFEECKKLDRLEEHAWAAVYEQVKQVYGHTELFDDNGKFIGKDPLVQELENIPAIQTVLKIMDRRSRLLALDKVFKMQQQDKDDVAEAVAAKVRDVLTEYGEAMPADATPELDVSE